MTDYYNETNINDVLQEGIITEINQVHFTYFKDILLIVLQLLQLEYVVINNVLITCSNIDMCVCKGGWVGEDISQSNI